MPTEIPLQDVSNQLGAGPAPNSDDVPEWERMPFPLPILEPSPVNEQPKPWKVNVGAMKTLPKRLRQPPPRPSIPQLKRYTVIPEYDVPLSDILEDKHPSPLSLREFEEYLLYVERSVENLYFCLWFKQYTNEYNDWAERRFSGESSSSSIFHVRRTPKSLPPNESLAKSFQAARELFFNDESQYELNVTDEMIDPIRHLVRPAPKGPPRRRREVWEEASDTSSEEGEDPLAVSKDLFATMYARPRDMEKIKCEVEGLLRQSLTRFLQLAFTNAGRSHDNIAYGVWAFYMVATIATSVSLIVGRKSRPLRLVVIPMQLIAWWVLFASLNGICTAIYAFGDARQLHPYELYVIRCRARMGLSYAPEVDYKKIGATIGKLDSVEPIIQPHTVYKPRHPDDFRLVERVRTLFGSKREEADAEQGRGNGSEQGESASFESAPASALQYNNSPPAFPAPAYIPTSPHSALQQCTQIQAQSQPDLHTRSPNDTPGKFSITALNPKTPPLPSHWDEEDKLLVRAMDLDLGDPRALGVYGPMVNIPSEFVRRVQRDIFMRSLWLTIAVTVPIMAVLLVIPVPS
ncbi:hypothetical protein RhiJN_27882 [Ceratobasidium sp. AG-Ba]|nr:hypothetical protein RhiJN_27882 [Ceratobasidium sp. AG-Ba]